MIGFWVIMLGCFISFFGIGYQCAHDVMHRDDEYDDESCLYSTFSMALGGILIMLIGGILCTIGK